MHDNLTAPGALASVQQTTGIGRRAEQVGRLLPFRVLIGGHQDGIAMTRNDLDRITIRIHPLDEAYS